MKRVLVAGCGYVGAVTAELFHRAGWDVFGLTRSGESANKLAGAPWPMLACDIADRSLVQAKLGEFQGIELMIDCVSAGGGGVDEYRSAYLEGARNLLKIVAPKQCIFTSSTSVYAQTDGSWVTEESPAMPDRETGKILRETEELVLSHGGIVVRLAGLYGPGRWTSLQRFLDGTAVLEGEGAQYMNFTHRDDAAGALLFLGTHPASSGIYNVTDNTPVTQREFYEWLSIRFDKPLPPSTPPNLNRKRGWTSKRVSNAKIRGMGWVPHYPSFKESIESAP